MNTPPIVSPQEWEAAREQLLVKEKEHHARPRRLAAERRRMPWMAVEKDYRFEGPNGPASLADLFEGRRQLIVYRFFYAPDITTFAPGARIRSERVSAAPFSPTRWRTRPPERPRHDPRLRLARAPG